MTSEWVKKETFGVLLPWPTNVRAKVTNSLPVAMFNRNELIMGSSNFLLGRSGARQD